MKIAVCVKEIPDSSGTRRIDAATGRLVREGDQVLNSFDSHAIEAALEVREAGVVGDVHVTALLMGPEGATRTLQKALALGADDAVHVTDEALAGSDIVATARALAAAVKRGDYDLVIMGQQAGDSDCWVLPGAVAELLGRPVLTQASKLEVSTDGVKIERQTEIGYERLSAALPAVVSVSDAINEPRYPSLKAIMGAKRKPFEKLGLSDLGLDAAQVGTQGSRTAVLDTAPPPQREAGIKVEDDGTAAAQLADFLAQKNFI